MESECPIRICSAIRVTWAGTDVPVLVVSERGRGMFDWFAQAFR